MKIDLDTIEKQKALAAKHGGSVASLLGLSGSLESQPLFVLDRGLLGAEGEVLTPDRYVAFKSDKGFSKLKSERTVNCAEVVDLGFEGLASWHRWTFGGAGGKFDVTLVYYGTRNGLGPGDHMWYDLDSFPARSGAFYGAMQKVLPHMGLAWGFDFASTVRSRIEEAVAAFEGSPCLAADGIADITQQDVYAPWTAVYNAFSWFLAGAAACTGEGEKSWVELFRGLDGFYARILVRFLAEMERQGDRVLDMGAAVLSLGDQFQRLSALWYLRQISRVHLAEKHLQQEEIRPWTLKILTPRARIYSNETKIQIPDRSLFEDQISALVG